MATLETGRSSVVLLDFEHETSRTTIHWTIDTEILSSLPSLLQANIVASLNKIADCSNASIKYEDALWPVFGTEVPPAVAGNYPNSEDHVDLYFVDEAGFTVRVSIAAPIDGIFKADQETIDPASTALAALIANFTHTPDGDTGYYVSSRNGKKLTDCYRGVRVRGKNKKEAPGYFVAIG